MTQGPAAYGVPSGYPPGHPAPAAKRRPSAWWFVLGIVLLLAAGSAAVGLFWWTLSGFLDTDARVAVDGAAHRVDVGTGGDRMLWVDESARSPQCHVVDRQSGEDVVLHRVSGDFRRSGGAPGEWRGTWRFAPGSGHLEITCAGATLGPPTDVQIGPAPQIGSFLLGILATILVPLVLGLAGLLVLLITGILWAVRPEAGRG